MSTEYDNVAALVQQVLAHQQQQTQVTPSLHSQLSAAETQAPSRVPDLMHSLSQVAAMSLQNQLRAPSSNSQAFGAGTNNGFSKSSSTGLKRGAQEDANSSTSSRPRTG